MENDFASVDVSPHSRTHSLLKSLFLPFYGLFNLGDILDKQWFHSFEAVLRLQRKRDNFSEIVVQKNLLLQRIHTFEIFEMRWNWRELRPSERERGRESVRKTKVKGHCRCKMSWTRNVWECLFRMDWIFLREWAGGLADVMTLSHL